MVYLKATGNLRIIGFLFVFFYTTGPKLNRGWNAGMNACIMVCKHENYL